MEITSDIDLTFEQESLVDMHSMLNILNVLALELHVIERETGGSARVQTALKQLYRMGKALRTPTRARQEIARGDSFVAGIREAVTLARMNIESRKQPEAAAELERAALNIENILVVFRVRAREVLNRTNDAFSWIYHDVAELHRGFRHFFDAIQYNSGGDYSIVGTAAEHHDGSYLIQLSIRGSEDNRIIMPAEFQDVMRDLIANARKYTEPGGRITAVLQYDASELRFSIEDTGIGIPPNEIERVVLFGERGSNAAAKPTRGGGFGLTKAYYIARQCGGRMWIDSELNKGTAIEIAIPCPEGITYETAS